MPEHLKQNPEDYFVSFDMQTSFNVPVQKAIDTSTIEKMMRRREEILGCCLRFVLSGVQILETMGSPLSQVVAKIYIQHITVLATGGSLVKGRLKEYIFLKNLNPYLLFQQVFNSTFLYFNELQR